MDFPPRLPHFFHFFTRYHNKISFIAFISVFISLLLMITISYSGIRSLHDSTSVELERSLDAVNQSYLSNYLTISGDYVDKQMQYFLSEQATLAEIYQTALDNEAVFSAFLAASREQPLFRATLSDNGRWRQNTPDEITSVLLPRYMNDEQNQLRPEAVRTLRNSSLLNLFLPAFYNHGTNKLWLYYVGPQDNELLRTFPWNDSGSAMEKIYPAFSDSPIWEAFNPGLVHAWEAKISNPHFSTKKTSELAIIKPPSQDGFSGKPIITLQHPVWNKERTRFSGSISIDVDLAELIRYTRNLKPFGSGFAFLCQSNGNILAVNEAGEKILGLKNLQDSTMQINSGAAYNPMLRFFKDSSFESVRSFAPTASPEIKQETLLINGSEYLIMQKTLKPFNSWTKDNGLHQDVWTLGFVIPKQELYAPYHAVRKQVHDSGQQIILWQCAIVTIFIAFAALAINFIARRMTSDLNLLQSAAASVANADYETPVRVNSKDEIGNLATAIDDMRLRIKSSFDELNEKNNALHISNDKLYLLSERYIQLIGIVASLMERDSQDEAAFFNDLLTAAKKIVPEADYGSITLLESGIWRFQAVEGHDLDGLNALSLPYHTLANFKEITIIDDSAALIENRLPEKLRDKFKACAKPASLHLFAPLKVGKEFVGNIALDIAAGSPSSFSDESIKAMQALANVASAFILRNRYALRLAKLHEIDRAILAKQTLSEIATVALKHLSLQIPCQRASCAVLEPGSEELRLIALLSEQPTDIEGGYSFPITPKMLAYLKISNVLIINDLTTEDQAAECDQLLMSEGFRSYLRVPLESEGALLGSLNFSSLSPYAFTQAHADLANEVAATLTIALQQAHLQDQIRSYTVELERRVLELEKKNAEMERFTYTVSHDLKSPLITIKGFLGLLIEDAKAGRTDRMEKDLQRINNAADKMQHLLEDLLELSRIGRIINPPTCFAMSEVCSEACELLHGSINEKNISLQLAHDMPDVTGDRIRIREVWQNLLENAVKYIGENHAPQISLGWYDSSEGPVFFVRDSGIGIDPAYQEKIFGLFNKLDPHSEGTGIGLALVKRIVELHNGRIWLESEGPGTGSCFYFTLAHKEV